MTNKRIPIEDITWIYDGEKETCEMVNSNNHTSQILTVSGTTNKGGKWYQIGEEKRHWISFNPDKFNPHNLEVFYKRIERKEIADGTTTDFITYYRQYHKGLEKGDHTLFFSFSQFDEWIQVEGKWKSKYGEGQNQNKQPWKEFNNDDK